MDNSDKVKHLELIQAIINRMGVNSFYLKGWSVTLVAAVFALATKDGQPRIVPVALLPSVVFWFLDAYFLCQERAFRQLYDKVRTSSPDAVDFAMDTSEYWSRASSTILRAMFSVPLRWFYGSMVAAAICMYFVAVI